MEEHPDKTVSTTLVMAQLHLSQGGVYQACDRLKELGDLQYKPGVVCTCIQILVSFIEVLTKSCLCQY